MGIKGVSKMILTVSQCKLLLSIFSAGVTRASQSGIPIGQEYYDDIDNIREKLYREMAEALKREEETKNGSNS